MRKKNIVTGISLIWLRTQPPSNSGDYRCTINRIFQFAVKSVALVHSAQVIPMVSVSFAPFTQSITHTVIIFTRTDRHIEKKYLRKVNNPKITL